MNKYIKIFVLCVSVLSLVLIIGIHTTTAQSKLSKYDAYGFLVVQPNVLKINSSSSSDAQIDAPSIKAVDVFINDVDVKQGSLADCFSYYAFGSVDVSLNTTQASYESGNPVIIKGVIKNNNKYPLIGLDIKARVVKNIPNPKQMRAEIIVLDEFDIAKNINIAANSQINVSSTYLLPQNAPSGSYQVLFYAVEKDRFNLAGLSFTNDITASRLSFSVEGKNPDHIYLDQTQIMVEDQPHNVMAFMTQHEAGARIPITIPLNNPSSEAKIMKVTYNLYSWDSANPENQIGTQSEEVMVPAKGEVKLLYVIDKGSLPVYYLNIVAEPVNQTQKESVISEKTISNIRLVVKNESKPRLNFVGVDSYPLKKDVEATLVTCFHNTSSAVDTNITKIETTIYDQTKLELSKIIYQGKTISDITGLVNKFTPKKDVTQFTIISNMVDANGETVDSVEKTYRCEDINASLCPQKKPTTTRDAIAIVAGIIVAASAAVVYRRKAINNLKV